MQHVAHRASDEIADLKSANALLHSLITNRDAEIERLRTAIFNTMNDLAKKRPNISAMRSYLASVYNARAPEQSAPETQKTPTPAGAGAVRASK